MKKALSLMLVFAMLLLVGGCVTDSGSSSSDNNGTTGGSVSAATYMPFKTGSVWNYSDTQTEYWSNPPTVTTNTSTTTCTGQSTVDGKSYWMMDESGGTTMYLRVQDNDVYTYGSEMWYGMAKVSPKIAVDTPRDLLFLRFGVDKNATWQIWNYTDNSTPGYAITITVTGKYIGKEKVTTSSATYSNCARFDITTSISSTSSGFTYAYDTTTSLWFAPNVGEVKTSDTEEQAGVAMYKFESTLTSYVP